MIELSQLEQVQQWTGLTCGDILFDSDIHNWSIDTSELNHQIEGKSQVVFVIEEENGEVFGFYESGEIGYEEDAEEMESETEFESFVFNLHSNGRLNSPMKCAIKGTYDDGTYLFKSDSNELISVGCIHLYKKEQKQLSECVEYKTDFEFGGRKNVICGKRKFTPKRILVIQMN